MTHKNFSANDSAKASCQLSNSFLTSHYQNSTSSLWKGRLALIWYRCFSLTEEIWLHFLLTTSWCVWGEGLEPGVPFQEVPGWNPPGRVIECISEFKQYGGGKGGGQRHIGLRQAQTCRDIQIISSCSRVFDSTSSRWRMTATPGANMETRFCLTASALRCCL